MHNITLVLIRGGLTLDSLRIQVKKIRCHDEESKFTIFEATLLTENKKTGHWKESKERYCFIGYFIGIFTHDRFLVNVEKKEHKVYGEEYIILQYQREEPGTLDDIRQFLIHSTPGLGMKRANQILECYGLDTISEIKNNPAALDNFGLRTKAKQNLRQFICENDYFEQILVFLQVYDIDHRYAFPIFKRYGSSALHKMQDSPYSLYLDRIFDFKAADKLSSQLQLPYNSSARIAYSILAYLRFDSEMQGHVYTNRQSLSEKLSKFLSIKGAYPEQPPIPEEELELGILKLIADDFVVLDEADGDLYLKYNYISEMKIVQRLNCFMSEPKQICYNDSDIAAFLNNYEQEAGFQLAQEQQKAVFAALQSPISILTGGPGTGKTQTINTIISAIKTLTPDARIKLCAPTGKAAIRMSEVCNLQSSTIHRMLHLGVIDKELGLSELECDFLLIDEFSMVDIYICYRLFLAVSPTARIIIVGDYEQLPSVGPGLVLRDFIQSELITVTKLDQVFRQNSKSRIIKNAHAIIHQTSGESIQLCLSKKPGGDFYYIEETSPSKIRKLIVSSIQKLEKDYHYPLSAIQVLSPIRSRDLGVDRLNSQLQEVFNSNGLSYNLENCEFRIGDKVMHIKNNYDLNVFNGESGTITNVGYALEKAVLVKYPDKEIWYSSEDLDQLELSYAATVHKSQGNEYPVVILPVHETIQAGLNKNLIYTALTRAKNMVIIIGSRSAMSFGLRHTATMQRNSKLVKRMRGQL